MDHTEFLRVSDRQLLDQLYEWMRQTSSNTEPSEVTAILDAMCLRAFQKGQVTGVATP